MSKFRFTADIFNTGYPAQDQICADAANAALDKHLRECKKVYKLDSGIFVWYENLVDEATHSAILFDLEEIKPTQCLHSSLRTRHDGKLDCNDCGKALEYRLVEV